MNIIRLIAKNIVALFAGQFVNIVVSLALSIFIARNLGAIIFGQYSFALAFSAIFAVFSDLGYNTLLIKEISRDKSQTSKYLNNTLSMRALLSLIIFALIVIIINAMNYSADVKKVIYLFGIYTLVISFSAVFKVTFRAFEKMEYEASITLFTSIIRGFLGILVLFLGYGLIELAWVFLFSSIFDVSYCYLVFTRKYMKPRFEFDFEFWKNTAKVALPLSMLSVFALIYVRIDTIMLSIIEGDAVVGWYNAAYNLVVGFKIIPQIFMNALFPLMSSCSVSSPDLLKKMYEKSFNYLFIFGLPLAVIITLLANKIIISIYGDLFYPSTIALQILAWDVLLVFLYSCSAFVLISIGKHNKMAVFAGSAAFLNVILNLILIPSYGYIGAAIATIVAEGFLLISYMYLNFLSSYTIPIFKIIAKPIIACSVAAVFIVRLDEIYVLLQIVIFFAMYFIVLHIVRGFSEEDINLFKKLMRR